MKNKIFYIALFLIISCKVPNEKAMKNICLKEIYYEEANGVEPSYIVIKIIDFNLEIDSILRNKEFNELSVVGNIVNEKLRNSIYYNGVDNNTISLILPTYNYIKFDKKKIDDDLITAKVSLLINNQKQIFINNCI